MKNQLERIAGALELGATRLGSIETRLAHLAMMLAPKPLPPLRNDAADYAVPKKKARKRRKSA